ncbi:MAG: phosphate signaling complex protein PhoU [Verrucomicrobia bacterium]|nr:phosphate signaling complex protein PhoU [Verrucomicrobiota bacterium]
MHTPIEKELDELKQKLLTMASHTETSVKEAVAALVNRDDALVLKVKVNDDVLDRFEVEVDELAVYLLAKAPLATDLRSVLVAMKISQNLERIGDEANKIAKRARDLNREAPLKTSLDFAKMAETAGQMLKGALDAFVNRNSAAARAVIERDAEVNALNKQARLEMEQLMMASPENVRRALNVMIAVKCLERIGDHATNIAEEVVYLCEANDIRHGGK